MRFSRTSSRGFTLIELLVVIAILGVLAAVVIISVDGFSNQADRAACVTDMRNVVDAEEVHHAETGSYTDEAGLVAAGRLRSLSDSHDVVLTPDGYDVVAVGGCAEDGNVASANEDDTAGDSSEQSEQAAKLALAEDATGGVTIDGFDAGWTTFGAAEINDGSARLTPDEAGTAGAVLFGAPVPTGSLRATFAARVGKGGEGTAFVLLDPESGAKAIEAGGDGFAGLPGETVTIDAGHLLGDWHEVTVEINDSTLVVSVDGQAVHKQGVKLRPEMLLGFSASAGKAGALHEVAKLHVTG